MITGAREGDEISLMNIQKFVRVVAIRDAYIYIHIYIYIRRQLTPTEKKTQDGGRRLKAGGEKEDDIIDKGRVLPIASCLSLQRLRGVGRGEREHKR